MQDVDGWYWYDVNDPGDEQQEDADIQQLEYRQWKCARGMHEYVKLEGMLNIYHVCKHCKASPKILDERG